MSLEADLDAVVTGLREGSRFLVTSHENPDGDALGSLLAMHLALQQLGKDSVMMLAGASPLPGEYRFLELPERGLVRERPGDVGERILVAVDCAQETRIADPDLIARGVNVDFVRARLRAVGEIVTAVPVVGEGGAIAFRFVFLGEPLETDVDAWRADGMVCSKVEQETVPAPVAASVDRGAATLSSAHYVRVDLARLDDLMRMIGDLVIRRARLGDDCGGDLCDFFLDAVGHRGTLGTLRPEAATISRMTSLTPPPKVMTRLRLVCESSQSINSAVSDSAGLPYLPTISSASRPMY